MATKKEDVATVLAFEKKLVSSDGYFYGTIWAERESTASPLILREKSVRGTISNRLNKAQKDDPAKLNAAVENANLQTVDSCTLSLHQDTLKMCFSLKVLPGVEKPSACNSAVFRAGYSQSAQAYIERYGFQELAKRYATNLANGRFLWRNRFGAAQVEVKIQDHEGNSWLFGDALEISTRSFDHEDSRIADLAKRIASALKGDLPYLLLELTACAQVGAGQEVYPSEELVLDKGKGKKSKILYAVDGVAGMHSQKIGNALRTIDDWYPNYEEAKVGPIAIEPYGAVTNLGTAFRSPKQKVDFYTLFDVWARGGELPRPEDEHYVMAVLIRGGVFGESGKE